MLKGREGPAADVFTSQYTAIQTTLGPRNVRASVSIANSALISTHLIVSNQCDLCDVKSNAGAPSSALSYETKMWIQLSIWAEIPEDSAGQGGS